jgi:uncharacterized protein
LDLRIWSVDLALADSLARTIAAAHARAPVVDAAPWIDALGAYVEQNDAAFREHPELFPAPAAERLTAACREALSRIRPLLLARGSRGLVPRSSKERRCRSMPSNSIRWSHLAMCSTTSPSC